MAMTLPCPESNASSQDIDAADGVSLELQKTAHLSACKHTAALSAVYALERAPMTIDSLPVMRGESPRLPRTEWKLMIMPLRLCQMPIVSAGQRGLIVLSVPPG